MSSDYVSRENVEGKMGEPTGPDGLHPVDPTEHVPTEETPEEREARENQAQDKRVEGGTGPGPVNEDRSGERYGDEE